METKYSAKIRELLEGKLDDETFKTWLMEQPMLDQAEIFREIKNTIDSEINLEENPIPEFETLDFFIDEFEDKVLDLKLAEQLERAEIENLSKLNADIETTYETMREQVNFHIINNDPSADFMKTVALKMIAAEKESNRYEAENWPALLYL